MFHMGWFIAQGYGVHGWNLPWSGSIGTQWMKPDIYIDLGRAIERAGFDYMMLEDGSLVPDSFGGTPEWFARKAWMIPKNDPMPLVPLIGQATQHLGIVATMTTSFYPPFIGARLAATLDHLTEGRVGLNIVTAHNDRAAQNFGLDQHHEHDLRYEMADEWMDVAYKLWGSWDADAIRDDPEQGTFADFTKIHPIDHVGRFHKVRGPLNTCAGPQGRPVICQAGGSPAGRSFAARHADTILARFRSIDAAREFRSDIHRLALAHGRRPTDIKILYMMSAVLDETDEGARNRYEQIRQGAAKLADYKLAFMSYTSGKDFSKFDLDQPIPEIKTNAAQASTAALTKAAGAQKTLREIATETASGGFDYVGSPDTVSAQMGETMQAIGGDGFLVSHTLTRRAIAEFTDGLAPALRRRGLIRSGYSHKRFRDNLLEF